MKHDYVPYNSNLKVLARTLRRNATEPEIIFWKECLGKNKTGYKFLRQKPLDIFIADFYCPELMMVVEIDGPSHQHQQEADEIRTERLNNLGIEVLRFTNEEVLNDLENVKIILKNAFKSRKEEVGSFDKTL